MNNNTKVRIVAAVVDTRNLTLYKVDGTTIMIPQGDPRLRKILEEATPMLVLQNYADIDIDPAPGNSYADFEKEGSGAVKFFRIAKAKLKNLFNAEDAPAQVDTSPVKPVTLGAVPEPLFEDKGNVTASVFAPAEPEPVAAVETRTVVEDPSIEEVQAELDKIEEVVTPPVTAEVQRNLDVISEIMKHAVPATSPDFHEQSVKVQGDIVDDSGKTDNQKDEVDTAENTIIAVVDGKIIPGMEKIKTQFTRAAKMGSTQGVELFLRRLGSVIDKRSHSVEDLLKFMERADLPIADDGTIIIYKILRHAPSSREEKSIKNVYVDCHSKKVEQWVGAYVCMDEKLVDHNRNNECSNGLHVARRGYLSNFSGDICVLAKLAPEDVIAVPSYDANKMRVCGYHIIAEIPNDLFNRLKSNQAMTSSEAGKILLADAMAGKHIGKTHEVRITGQMGNGVVTKKLEKVAVAPKPVEVVAEPAELPEALENPKNEALDKPTDPMEVVKSIEQVSRKDQAQALYDAWQKAPVGGGKALALERLVNFKKAAKVSWEKLGVPNPEDPIAQPVPTKKTKVAAPSTSKGKAVNTAPQTKEPVLLPPVEFKAPPESEGSPRTRILKLIAIGLDSKDIAQSVLAIKKASKKSWEYLGVKPEEVERITKLTS